MDDTENNLRDNASNQADISLISTVRLMVGLHTVYSPFKVLWTSSVTLET